MRSEVYFIAGLLLMTILAFISRCGGEDVQNKDNSDTVVTVRRSVDTVIDTVNLGGRFYQLSRLCPYRSISAGRPAV